MTEAPVPHSAVDELSGQIDAAREAVDDIWVDSDDFGEAAEELVEEVVGWLDLAHNSLTSAIRTLDEGRRKGLL